MTPKLAAFLREYSPELKALCRDLGKELRLDDLVFANAEGKPLNPSTPTNTFQKMAKATGLQGIRFHGLRHTFAGLMLLREPSQRLYLRLQVHVIVVFTMDVYSHIIDGMQLDPMILLDEAMPVGKNGALPGINMKSASICSIMGSNK